MQLRYTTLHPAVVGEVTDQVTAATIAATQRSTAPTTFSVHQWIRSAIRDSQQPTSPIASYLWNFRDARATTGRIWYDMIWYCKKRPYCRMVRPLQGLVYPLQVFPLWGMDGHHVLTMAHIFVRPPIFVPALGAHWLQKHKELCEARTDMSSNNLKENWWTKIFR